MALRVKRRRGHTRLSAKHQVTLPVDVVRAGGLEPGDEFRVELDASGAVVLRLVGDWIEEFSGALPGVWPRGALDELRDEWD